MFELIRINYISIKRSPLFDARIFSKIITVIGFSYLFVNFIFIGFFLDRIFKSIKPNDLPFDTFCRIFLFIWVVDIIIKFFYKSDKYIDIQPYLTLPIKLNRVFLLMFLKELMSKWNFIWVIILTPFLFRTFYPDNGLPGTFLLIISVYFISITISFFLRFINTATNQISFIYYPLSLIFAISLGYLAFNVAVAPNLIIDINLIFSGYKIWVFFVLMILFVGLYFLFIKFSKREIYLFQTGRNRPTPLNQIKWFDQLGINGEIIKLCLKEITRSQLKRNVFTSLLFLMYLLFFKTEAPFAIRLLLSLVPMLMFGSLFGEFTFIAESMLFDKLMTVPKNTPYLILKSKYLICLFIFAVFTILSIAFTMNKISILFWISTFFFGSGTMLFFIFQNAVYNKHRMDMLGSLRNLSNFNLHSFIATGFLMLILAVVFLLFLLTTESTALYFMLVIGVIFTFTSPIWLRNIYDRFLNRKYINMHGFRNF